MLLDPLDSQTSYIRNHIGANANSLRSYLHFVVAVLCVVALLSPLTAIIPIVVIANTTKGSQRKILLTLALVFSISFSTAILLILGRQGAGLTALQREQLSKYSDYHSEKQ